MEEKFENQNFYSSKNNSDEIDLGKIFRFLLMQLKKVVQVLKILKIYQVKKVIFKKSLTSMKEQG